MKNVSYYRHLHPESLKKLVAITKITAVSLLTVLPSTMQAEPTYSQSVVISIKTERMLLTDLFSQIEKKEKIFLSNAIERLSVNQQYEWVILLPGIGCHGCIQEAEFFMKKHISNEKILFVLTNIESLKILQQKTGVEIKSHPNVYIDRNNQFKLPTDHSIYPCVIQVNKGKLQQYAFQSPKTPALYNLEKLLKQQHKE